MKIATILTAVVVLMGGFAVEISAAEKSSGKTYSWQQQHVKVLPTGNLEWAPQPFAFETGKSVRYIDFENGDDNHDGLTKQTPWKHHPWDWSATGKAKSVNGATTYIFKRGVDYRGLLRNFEKTDPKDNMLGESGAENNPIRLTSDPEWGKGEASLLGSVRLPSEWKPCKDVKYPERIPDPGKVWALDLNPLGVLGTSKENDKYIELVTERNRKVPMPMPFIGLFRVDADGAVHKQHLARTPNWQPYHPSFALDYWHKVDGVSEGMQADFIKGHPQDYFTGGFCHAQAGIWMGGPMATEIKAGMYDSAKGVFKYVCLFNAWSKNLRYMIDNLPQYLDAPDEFYYDKNTGFLFYIPPEGQDPNKLRLELSRFHIGLLIRSQSHIEVSGLSIKYYQRAGINLSEAVHDVTIKHCLFEHLMSYGILQEMSILWQGEKNKSNITPQYSDRIRVLDNEFRNIWISSILITDINKPGGRCLGHVDIMRNKTSDTGLERISHAQSAQPSIDVGYPTTAEIAGNIIERSGGSGIMVHGGFGGADRTVDNPLSRIFVHHNKTIDTALLVNDYGGMSLWQGGPIYCYDNNIGNSVGMMPGGIAWWKTPPLNLSYSLYLDGAYKVYSFNNIIWSRSNNKTLDEFASRTPGYLMVFGFLNQFVNNTMYGTGEGVGGSGGHRNDVVSNVFAEVGYTTEKVDEKGKFIAHDRNGDPSLIGGGDDGSSGRRGVPSLAYANNIFHGNAEAGRIVRKSPKTPDVKYVEGKTIEELSQSMHDYPVRFEQLGWRAEKNPIVGKSSPGPIKDIAEMDFRPSKDSMAIDHGANYFIPWALSGNVGEWHFTENHADSTRSIDYSWYQYQAHFNRMMFEFVPSLDLKFNQATLNDYTDSPSEDWCKGAVVFDGKRFAHILDKDMRADILVPFKKVWQEKPPFPPWVIPETQGEPKKYAADAVLLYPGKLRKTLVIGTENLLVETIIKCDPSCGESGILGKYDGTTGYRLIVNASGQPEFHVASQGQDACAASKQNLKDGKWHHILAELDRKSGRMTMYIDGKEDVASQCSLAAETSIDNASDFLVGKTQDEKFFKGAMDFMRVCQGTLADAKTDIDELYEWQTNGPFKYDMCGHRPQGKRTAGAISNGVE